MALLIRAACTKSGLTPSIHRTHSKLPVKGSCVGHGSVEGGENLLQSLLSGTGTHFRDPFFLSLSEVQTAEVLWRGGYWLN